MGYGFNIQPIINGIAQRLLPIILFHNLLLCASWLIQLNFVQCLVVHPVFESLGANLLIVNQFLEYPDGFDANDSFYIIFLYFCIVILARLERTAS